MQQFFGKVVIFSDFVLCYLNQSGGTAKHTTRYVCHPPTFAGG